MTEMQLNLTHFIFNFFQKNFLLFSLRQWKNNNNDNTTGEHPAAMQHNAADKQHSVEQPMLVLPLAIAAGGIACTTKLMAILTVITAAMSSISLEIRIVLARFRKNLFNSMCWPSASVWIAR